MKCGYVWQYISGCLELSKEFNAKIPAVIRRKLYILQNLFTKWIVKKAVISAVFSGKFDCSVICILKETTNDLLQPQ